MQFDAQCAEVAIADRVLELLIAHHFPVLEVHAVHTRAATDAVCH